jgi:hypothetical protein
MNQSSASIAASAVCLAVLLSACGGGGGGDSGTLRLALTDAPACGFDRVDVTVQKVRVHKSGSANEADDGWSEVVLNPAKRVDLLSLTNGALAELGQTPCQPASTTRCASCWHPTTPPIRSPIR